MSLKNVLSKAKQLFVEYPDQDTNSLDMPMAPSAMASPVSIPNPTTTPAPVHTLTVNQIVEKSEGPNLDEITMTEAQSQDSLAPGGVPNFDRVYLSANLPKVSFGAEQALEVIASLPSDLPLQVKRATVQASLSAMSKAMNDAVSVSTESIVADASRKLAALSAFEDSLNLQTKKHVTNLDAEIKTYEEKIAALKAQIQKTQDSLTTAVGYCKAEGDKLDDVLEFFTLDVGASKNAPQG